MFSGIKRNLKNISEISEQRLSPISASKFSSIEWRNTRQTVWPDLATFGHFGNENKVFGNFWRVYLVLDKILNLFWLIFMHSGKCTLL